MFLVHEREWLWPCHIARRQISDPEAGTPDQRLDWPVEVASTGDRLPQWRQPVLPAGHVDIRRAPVFNAAGAGVAVLPARPGRPRAAHGDGGPRCDSRGDGAGDGFCQHGRHPRLPRLRDQNQGPRSHAGRPQAPHRPLLPLRPPRCWQETSAQAFLDPAGDAQCIGDDGQRRVHCADRREEARIVDSRPAARSRSSASPSSRTASPASATSALASAPRRGSARHGTWRQFGPPSGSAPSSSAIVN